MGATTRLGKGKQSTKTTRTGKVRIKGMTVQQLSEAVENARSAKERHRYQTRLNVLENR
jgi:hypothetical protein